MDCYKGKVDKCVVHKYKGNCVLFEKYAILWIIRNPQTPSRAKTCRETKNRSWGDFSLFCLDSMRSTNISAKSSQICGYKVSLSDRPWMSSYIMQCVSWLWTVFWPSSDYFPGELKWRWARYSILQVWSARNSNILRGDLEQIANWVEAARSSSKRPWSKGWNPLMGDSPYMYIQVETK
jgi:hypothetical protein